MSIKPILNFTFVTPLLAIFIFPNSVHAISTITQSSETNATREEFQRKTWHDNTRYWATIDDGTDIEFWYSTNGIDWTQNTSATISNKNYNISVYADNTRAYYVRKEGFDIHTAAASSYPGVSFSWGSETKALDGTSSSDEYYQPHISRDSDGNLWIISGHYDGSNIEVTVLQSINTDDITSWDFGVKQKIATSSGSNNAQSIVPLDSGNMYAVFHDDGNINGCYYDETSSKAWEDGNGNSCIAGNNKDTFTTSGISSSYYFDVTTDTQNYDVHLINTGNAFTKYTRWDNGTGTNGAPQTTVTIDSDTGSHYGNAITVNTANYDLYSFWNNATANKIYFSTCDISTATSECSAASDWSSTTEVGSITSDSLSGIASNYSGNNRAFVLYKNGTAANYDVNFHAVLKPPPSLTFNISAVAADTVHNDITTSEASTYNSLPFSNLTNSTPKYMAHSLYISSNAESGYGVTMQMINYFQGVYPGNNIDPFISSWGTPTTWTEPTGTTSNVDTGWIGANTTDTRVTGWESAAQKFGPVNSTANKVMTSSTTDAGTTAYVTFAIEVNIWQPADYYTGSLTYNILPSY